MIETWRAIFKDNEVQQILTILAAACLLSIGFLFSELYLYPLAFLGVALFITNTVKSSSKSSAFFTGWGTGLIFYIIVFANITTASFPIAWIGIENVVLQWLTIILVWTIVSLAMGIGYGVLGLLIYWFKTNSWYDLLTIPLMWVVCEMLAAWFFSLITLGEGTLLGGHFTLGFLGYLLANNLAVLQLAALGGVYVLSFLLVAMGALIFKWWVLPVGQKKNRLGIAILSLIFFIIILDPIYSVFLSNRTTEDSAHTLNVAVISRYVPTSLDEDMDYWNQRYIDLRELIAPLRNIDLLILPESSAFLIGGAYGADQVSTFLHTLSSTDILVIDSADTHTDDGALRSVGTYYSYNKTLRGEKQFLVPFGEYLPYIYVLTMKLLGQGELVNNLQSLRGYTPGTTNTNPEVAGATVAVRFCDEVMSPSLYRRQVKNGANILVNISSFSWFHGKTSVYKQMQNIAKVRAVENSRWYVQSGNMAPAFILDHHGRVIKENPLNSLSVLKTQVPSRNNRTIYSLIGE